MIEYTNLAYFDDQLEGDLIGKQYPEHTMKALNHVRSIYFPLYRVTKAIDLFIRGDITEQEFRKAYNTFRSETQCVCKED